jgi:hypothetical protein
MPVLERILKAVYLQAKVNPELVLDLEFSASEFDDRVNWNSLYFDGEIKSSIGFGFSIIDDGFLNMEMYGGGTIEPEFCLIPELEWKQMTGSYFVGTKISAFYMYELEDEYEWPHETIKGPAYYECGGTDRGTDDLELESIDIDAINNGQLPYWKVEHPDYGDEPYAEFLGQNLELNTKRGGDLTREIIEDSILVSNLYKNASPVIASMGNNSMIVWVHDDLDLGDTQSKELLFSINDSQGWSIPTQLTNNLKVDHSPEIKFINENLALIVWEQINDSEISDDSTLTPEIAKKSEILYSFFDFQSNGWTEPSYLTENTSLDARSKIRIGDDGTIMVFWVQNPNGELMGSIEYPSRIMAASWNGNGWVSNAVTELDLAGVLSFDAEISLFNDATVVYSTDQTGDLSTLDTVELFYVNWDGFNWSSPTQITNNFVIDDNPYILHRSNGEKWLLWNEGGKLMLLKNDWTEEPVTTKVSSDDTSMSSFKVSEDDFGNLFLIWQDYSQEGSDLFASIYDALTETWKIQDRLTSNIGVEKQFNITFNADNSISIIYAFDNVNVVEKEISGQIYSNVVEYQSTDLHLLQYTPDSDLTISELCLPYRPNPEPGETVLIRADIVNSGDWAVENPSIAFYDGDPANGGLLIDTYNHVGFVSAGETISAEIQWTIPEETSTSKTIYAIVDPNDLVLESDETNNQLILTTILPDLIVSSASSNYYDQHTVVPAAVIYNNGKLAAENVLVEFREGAVDGTVIYSEVIPIIEKEGFVAVSTEISVEGWEKGAYEYYVTIDSGDSILEVDEENNTDNYIIEVLPDLVIYAGDISATLSETGGPVEVTIRNWGTSDATNIMVSLYEGPDIDLTRTPIYTWNAASLSVDEIVTLSTTIDYLPDHLFAVIDPDNVIEELEEKNNVGYEELPVIHGLPVSVLGSSDPNLADIIAVQSEFDLDSGQFSNAVQAPLFDASVLTDTDGLCDISTLIEFTDMQGKIVLVEESSACEYDVQVNHAASLGAVAVLIYNTPSGGNLREIMTGPEVLIPAAYLANQDGLDLIPVSGQEVVIPSSANAITILDPYP